MISKTKNISGRLGEKFAWDKFRYVALSNQKISFHLLSV